MKRKQAPAESAEPAPRKAAKRVPRMVELHPRGDVIFNAQDKVHYRVSSQILSLASKAFSAMFDPLFLESRDLDSDKPPMIDFPEDDHVSFGHLLRLLHFHAILEDSGHEPGGPWIISEDIVSTLILGDKYDCNIALGPSISRLAIAAEETFQQDYRRYGEDESSNAS